jgi:hypothetical protein
LGSSFERNAVNPKLNFTIETVAANFCVSENNEARVAATFWDAYDTINDGSGSKKDTWNFFHA